MKKLSAVLAMLILGSMTAALPIAAATVSSDQIKKGTPVIDGKLDEIYTQSARFDLEEEDLGAVYSTWDGEIDHDAMAHFLWDDDYFYMCIDVKDGDVVSRGQEYIDSTDNPWMNDAVESWFLINGEYQCKVHNDAFGLIMFVSAEGSVGTPAECFIAEESKYQCMATGNGFTIEAAFKPNPEVFAGFKAGDELGFCIQLNDIQDEKGETVCCSGSQNPGDYLFTLSAEEAIPPAPEMPAEDVPDAPVSEGPAAPATADAGLAAAASLLALSAGAVLSFRKK